MRRPCATIGVDGQGAIAFAWPIPLDEPATRAVMRCHPLSHQMGGTTHFDTSVLGCQPQNAC